MSIKKLWGMVNNVRTHHDIRNAEEAIRKSDVDNETFDDLMNALAYQSRELYRNGETWEEEEAAYLKAEREGMAMY